MSKSPAVLSYPNSNNLGDIIQSLAAKQVLNKIKTFDIDRDELGAALWKNKLNQNELIKLTCSDWSERCSSNGKKPKMSSKRNRKDYEFKEIDEKALEMEHLMENMEGMGMGGMNMMDRESMMDMYGGEGGMGGYGGMDPYGGGMDPYAGMNMGDMEGMDPGAMGADGVEL